MFHKVPQVRNSSSCIHPDPFAAAIAPLGAPIKKWACKFFRGKINMGGTMFPHRLSHLHSTRPGPGTCNVSSQTKLLKNILTLCTLKLVARDRLVAWGARSERSGLPLMNPVIQSFPAISFTSQDGGIHKAIYFG